MMGRERRTLAILFGAAVAVGLLSLRDPFWGGNFYDAVALGSGPPSEVFFRVIDGYYYRPVPAMFIAALYQLFGLSFESYRILNALLLGAGAVTIFYFHRKMGSPTPPAALSALLYISIPPTMNILWQGAEPELITIPIAYASLSIFLSLGQNGGGRVYPRLLGLAVLILAGAMTKEDIRGLLPIALAGLAFWPWREHRLTRHQWAALFTVAGAVAASILLQVVAVQGAPRGFFDSPKIGDVPGFARHLFFSLFQFTSPVLFGGVLLLLFGALLLLPSASRWLATMALLLSLLLPFLGLLAGGPFTVISIWEVLSPSNPMQVPIAIFSALAIAALVLHLLRGETVARTYSLILLVGFATIVLGTAFSPTVRVETTTRTYLLLFPLLAWLISDSALKLLRRRQEGRGLRIAAALCAVFLVYHVAASSIDVAQYMSASSRAQFAAGQVLAKLPLRDQALFTLSLFHIRPSQIAMYQGVPYSSDLDYSWNPIRTDPEFRIPKGNVPIYLNLERLQGYVHLERVQHEVPPGACAEMKGTHREWYPGRWDLGFPLWNAMAYGCPRTSLDLSVDANTTVVFEAKNSYYEVPRWLEDGLYRWLRGLPFGIPSTSRVGIYRLS